MVSELKESAEDDEWNCILSPGAAQYHMFVITAGPEEIKRLKIDFKKEADDQYLRRKALVKIGDTWELESWNTITNREFCREKPEENVKSVILILSNADLENAGNIPFTVETDGECEKTITGNTKNTEKGTESYTEKGDANFLFVDSKHELSQNNITPKSIRGRYEWTPASSAGSAEVIVEFEYDLP